jgi:hypothetical protein
MLKMQTVDYPSFKEVMYNIMNTIMPQSELVRRAATFVAERIAEGGKRDENPPVRLSEKEFVSILDEAGMRFNLSPSESRALYGLFHGQDEDASE